MSRFSSRIPNRSGNVFSLVVFGIVAAALAVFAVIYWLNMGETRAVIDPITVKVTNGEFVSQVLDQGEVQSSENVEIRCQVRARNGSISVIQVVPEGSLVKGGDFLVELDSSSFDKELEQQLISVTNAKTSLIQADADVKVAIESKKEYVQGLFLQSMQTIENDIYDAKSAITTAEQELNQAKVVVSHSSKLLNKGFITKASMETDEFEVEKRKIALEKARNELSLAENQKYILKEITQKKELIQLESNIEAANVKHLNAQENLKVEETKQAEIEEMITKCTVEVPEGVSGQVVYAKESSRGGNDWMLEEGASVRERQVLVRLPNPEKMEVKTLINEQSITQIKVGMPAEIKVDALNNVTLQGVVTKVNQYAESGGWMSSTVRKYAVMVQILGPPDELKPGMNASVTIQVRAESDALLAPIQTVYAVGEQQFCLIKKGNGEWETREIDVDGDNSQMVLIKGGLKAGEELVMNPVEYKEYMELPESNTDTKIEIPEAAANAAKLADKNKNANKTAPPNGKGGDGPSRGENEDGKKSGPPSGGGGFDADSIVKRSMDRYDTNSDGKIDSEEMGSIEGRGAQMVKNADSNSDGEVTTAELKKAMAAMMKRFSGGGGGQRGGGGGQRGGGGQ